MSFETRGACVKVPPASLCDMRPCHSHPIQRHHGSLQNLVAQLRRSRTSRQRAHVPTIINHNVTREAAPVKAKFKRDEGSHRSARKLTSVSAREPDSHPVSKHHLRPRKSARKLDIPRLHTLFEHIHERSLQSKPSPKRTKDTHRSARKQTSVRLASRDSHPVSRHCLRSRKSARKLDVPRLHDLLPQIRPKDAKPNKVKKQTLRSHTIRRSDSDRRVRRFSSTTLQAQEA